MLYWTYLCNKDDYSKKVRGRYWRVVIKAFQEQGESTRTKKKDNNNT